MVMNTREYKHDLPAFFEIGNLEIWDLKSSHLESGKVPDSK